MTRLGSNVGRLAGVLLLAALFFLQAAQAHESRPAYLEIKESAPGQYAVLWRTPVLSGMRLPLVLTMPEGVTNLKPPAVQELTDSLVERRWIDGGPNGLAGKRIEITGLQFTITDALVRVELLDGRTMQTIVRPSQPWVEIAASQSRWEVMVAYIVEGILHILSGADHLLFVFGLLLIVGSAWTLLKTVTAFTVAHSITLSMATLGYADAPALPVEAAIALSILFLGSGDHPLVARRDELHHPPSVGRGIRLRAAARVWLRLGTHNRRVAPAGRADRTPVLQHWGRTGAARVRGSRAGDATIASLDQSPLAALGADGARLRRGDNGCLLGYPARGANDRSAALTPTARAAHQAAAVIRGSIVERKGGGLEVLDYEE